MARRHLARNVLAVLVAGSLASATGIGHPFWAMVSAVVPLVARDLSVQLTRGVHRVLGTSAGILVAALLFELHLSGLVLIMLVAALQLGAELLVGRNYGLALLVITPLALLMVQLAAPQPTGTLLWDRWIETLIGVLVGVTIGYLTRDRSPRPA